MLHRMLTEEADPRNCHLMEHRYHIADLHRLAAADYVGRLPPAYDSHTRGYERDHHYRFHTALDKNDAEQRWQYVRREVQVSSGRYELSERLVPPGHPQHRSQDLCQPYNGTGYGAAYGSEHRQRVETFGERYAASFFSDSLLETSRRVAADRSENGSCRYFGQRDDARRTHHTACFTPPRAGGDPRSLQDDLRLRVYDYSHGDIRRSSGHSLHSDPRDPCLQDDWQMGQIRDINRDRWNDVNTTTPSFVDNRMSSSRPYASSRHLSPERSHAPIEQFSYRSYTPPPSRDNSLDMRPYSPPRESVSPASRTYQPQCAPSTAPVEHFSHRPYTPPPSRDDSHGKRPYSPPRESRSYNPPRESVSPAPRTCEPQYSHTSSRPYVQRELAFTGQTREHSLHTRQDSPPRESVMPEQRPHSSQYTHASSRSFNPSGFYDSPREGAVSRLYPSSYQRSLESVVGYTGSEALRPEPTRHHSGKTGRASKDKRKRAPRNKKHPNADDRSQAPSTRHVPYSAPPTATQVCQCTTSGTFVTSSSAMPTSSLTELDRLGSATCSSISCGDKNQNPFTVAAVSSMVNPCLGAHWSAASTGNTSAACVNSSTSLTGNPMLCAMLCNTQGETGQHYPQALSATCSSHSIPPIPASSAMPIVSAQAEDGLRTVLAVPEVPTDEVESDVNVMKASYMNAASTGNDSGNHAASSLCSGPDTILETVDNIRTESTEPVIWTRKFGLASSQASASVTRTEKKQAVEEDYEHVCQVCRKTFACSTDLEKHLDKHINDEDEAGLAPSAPFQHNNSVPEPSMSITGAASSDKSSGSNLWNKVGRQLLATLVQNYKGVDPQQKRKRDRQQTGGQPRKRKKRCGPGQDDAAAASESSSSHAVAPVALTEHVVEENEIVSSGLDSVKHENIFERFVNCQESPTHSEQNPSVSEILCDSPKARQEGTHDYDTRTKLGYDQATIKLGSFDYEYDANANVVQDEDSVLIPLSPSVLPADADQDSKTISADVDQDSKTISADADQDSKTISADVDQDSKTISADADQDSETISADADQDSETISADADQDSETISSELKLGEKKHQSRSRSNSSLHTEKQENKEPRLETLARGEECSSLQFPTIVQEENSSSPSSPFSLRLVRTQGIWTPQEVEFQTFQNCTFDGMDKDVQPPSGQTLAHADSKSEKHNTIQLDSEEEDSDMYCSQCNTLFIDSTAYAEHKRGTCVQNTLSDHEAEEPVEAEETVEESRENEQPSEETYQLPVIVSVYSLNPASKTSPHSTTHSEAFAKNGSESSKDVSTKELDANKTSIPEVVSAKESHCSMNSTPTPSTKLSSKTSTAQRTTSEVHSSKESSKNDDKKCSSSKKSKTSSSKESSVKVANAGKTTTTKAQSSKESSKNENKKSSSTKSKKPGSKESSGQGTNSDNSESNKSASTVPSVKGTSSKQKKSSSKKSKKSSSTESPMKGTNSVNKTSSSKKSSSAESPLKGTNAENKKSRSSKKCSSTESPAKVTHPEKTITKQPSSKSRKPITAKACRKRAGGYDPKDFAVKPQQWNLWDDDQDDFIIQLPIVSCKRMKKT